MDVVKGDGENYTMQDRMTSVWLFSVSNLWFDWCWNNQPPPLVYSVDCPILCAVRGWHKSCRGAPLVHWGVRPIGGQAVGGMYNRISYRLGCLSRRTDGHHLSTRASGSYRYILSCCRLSDIANSLVELLCCVTDELGKEYRMQQDESFKKKSRQHSDHLWLNSSLRFRIRKFGNDFEVYLLLVT